MTYYGTVPNNQIRKALQESSIFVHPSTFPETSCLCLIEAMSAGCICIHSSLAALSETSNNLTFIYNYTENLHDHMTNFANKLIEAVGTINSYEVKTKLDQQKKYIDNKHNVTKFIKEWNKVFNNLLKTNKVKEFEVIKDDNDKIQYQLY